MILGKKADDLLNLLEKLMKLARINMQTLHSKEDILTKMENSQTLDPRRQELERQVVLTKPRIELGQ